MTSTHAHDHHARNQGSHDHGSHGHRHDHVSLPHEHGGRPRAQAPAASLLRTSALGRLGGVAAVLIVLWAAVAWALA